LTGSSKEVQAENDAHTTAGTTADAPFQPQPLQPLPAEDRPKTAAEVLSEFGPATDDPVTMAERPDSTLDSEVVKQTVAELQAQVKALRESLNDRTVASLAVAADVAALKDRVQELAEAITTTNNNNNNQLATAANTESTTETEGLLSAAEVDSRLSRLEMLQVREQRERTQQLERVDELARDNKARFDDLIDRLGPIPLSRWPDYTDRIMNTVALLRNDIFDMRGLLGGVRNRVEALEKKGV
jgi:hypothetical protein